MSLNLFLVVHLILVKAEGILEFPECLLNPPTQEIGEDSRSHRQVHSEINNLADRPMRFIQMWFFPHQQGLTPSVKQKKVEKNERANKLLPLVSNEDKRSLKIASDAKVYSCFLQKGKTAAYQFKEGYGGYLYVLEGGPLAVKNETLQRLDALIIRREDRIIMSAKNQTELLFVVVSLANKFS